jgi:hypothetical protein
MLPFLPYSSAAEESEELLYQDDTLSPQPHHLAKMEGGKDKPFYLYLTNGEGRFWGMLWWRRR